MKSVLIENSAIVFAVIQGAVTARANMGKIDAQLEIVNRYSTVDRTFRSVARNINSNAARLFSGADLLKAAGDIVLRVLGLMMKGMARFLGDVYYGSLFMDIIEKVAVDSRWAK